MIVCFADTVLQTVTKLTYDVQVTSTNVWRRGTTTTNRLSLYDNDNANNDNNSRDTTTRHLSVLYVSFTSILYPILLYFTECGKHLLKPIAMFSAIAWNF